MSALTGTLAAWNFQQSFGFIRPTASATDVYCHRRELRMPASDFRPGMKVRFEIGIDANDRPEAKQVEAMR